MDDLADRLPACHSGAVHDVMREMGLRAAVLPRTIAGPTAGPTADTKVAGPVVVCQPQDDTRALRGELSAEAPKRRGGRGDVVDGGRRDTERVTTRGFPVFCRFTSPIDIVAAWRPESDLRRAIRNGEDPQQAYLRYGKF
jgi:4-hydroxy-4-methyl-2-oxoglutarate aldolase